MSCWPGLDEPPFSYQVVSVGSGSLVEFEGRRYPAIEVDVWNDGAPDSHGAVVAFTVIGETGTLVRVMAQAGVCLHGHTGSWERFVEICAYPAGSQGDQHGYALAHASLVSEDRFVRGVPSTACFDPEDDNRCRCGSCVAFDEEFGAQWRVGDVPLSQQVNDAVIQFMMLDPAGWQPQQRAHL